MDRGLTEPKTEDSLNKIKWLHIYIYIHTYLLVRLKAKFIKRRWTLGKWGLISNIKNQRRKRESFINFSLMDSKIKLIVSSSKKDQEVLINSNND